MTDPHRQMREYLDTLIMKMLHVRALKDQLDKMTEWYSPARREAFEPGRFFFSLVRYTFGRSILIELCKIVDDREERSLPNYLKKAAEHATPMKPTRWVSDYSIPEGGRRQPIKRKKFVSLVDGNAAELEKHSLVLTKLLSRRDSELAHSDSKYFDNPELVFEHFPLQDLEIDALLDTVADILREHHLYLKEADMSMRIVSGREVDSVLSFNRAFLRVWRDKRLWRDCGIRPVEYKKDDYVEPGDTT